MAESVSRGPDFYCDEVLSSHTPVDVVAETDGVLAFRHPRPHWPVHVVVIPKRHVASLISVGPEDADLLVEMVEVIRRISEQVVAEHGGCQVTTNLGDYQTNKHLHWHIAYGSPLS